MLALLIALHGGWWVIAFFYVVKDPTFLWSSKFETQQKMHIWYTYLRGHTNKPHQGIIGLWWEGVWAFCEVLLVPNNKTSAYSQCMIHRESPQIDATFLFFFTLVPGHKKQTSLRSAWNVSNEKPSIHLYPSRLVVCFFCFVMSFHSWSTFLSPSLCKAAKIEMW